MKWRSDGEVVGIQRTNNQRDIVAPSKAVLFLKKTCTLGKTKEGWLNVGVGFGSF